MQARVDVKPVSYYRHARPEMLAFVPAGAARILEVGCGAGAFARLVKQARRCEYWGVEPDPAACAEARTVVDRLVQGPFVPRDLRGERFDCIVFNDVLEHLPDPESTLAECRALLAPVGSVVASLPNVRFLPYLYRLAWQGEFEYEDAGVLDRTHLRMFTRRSALRMFERLGFRVLATEGINPELTRSQRIKLALLNVATLGRFADARHPQFAIVAEIGAARSDVNVDATHAPRATYM